jgi:hypothetical protein
MQVTSKTGKNLDRKVPASAGSMVSKDTINEHVTKAGGLLVKKTNSR